VGENVMQIMISTSETLSLSKTVFSIHLHCW